MFLASASKHNTSVYSQPNQSFDHSFTASKQNMNQTFDDPGSFKKNKKKNVVSAQKHATAHQYPQLTTVKEQSNEFSNGNESSKGQYKEDMVSSNMNHNESMVSEGGSSMLSNSMMSASVNKGGRRYTNNQPET
jgi:hypothetical protein